MNVLVTDGENRSALAVARSLGRKGCRVVVSCRDIPCLASSSKFCSKAYKVTDPLDDRSRYLLEILDIMAKEGIHVILPTTEPSIYALNQTRAELPRGVILACAEPEQMDAVSDKVSLFRLAEKLRVPAPQTLYLSGPGDLQEAIGQIKNYPVVIKPGFSRIPDGKGFLSTAVRYAASKEELTNIYSKSQAMQYPSMIQEKICGPGTGLFTLFEKNRHLALFSHCRLLEKPPKGGVSVLSESVALDAEMVNSAQRLLSAVGWSGVAMVEFKRDLRDGSAKLMEINGRFWGTLQLAIACGVDFPNLYLHLFKGNYDLFPIQKYKVGHRLKWYFGILDHLLIRLKNIKLQREAIPWHELDWRILYSLVNILDKNSSCDVFDRNDMKPFLYEAESYIRQTLRLNV